MIAAWIGPSILQPMIAVVVADDSDSVTALMDVAETLDDAVVAVQKNGGHAPSIRLEAVDADFGTVGIGISDVCRLGREVDCRFGVGEEKGAILEPEQTDAGNQPELAGWDGERNGLGTGRIIRRSNGLAETHPPIRAGQIAYLLGAGEVRDVVECCDGDRLVGARRRHPEILRRCGHRGSRK